MTEVCDREVVVVSIVEVFSDVETELNSDEAILDIDKSPLVAEEVILDMVEFVMDVEEAADPVELIREVLLFRGVFVVAEPVKTIKEVVEPPLALPVPLDVKIVGREDKVVFVEVFEAVDTVAEVSEVLGLRVHAAAVEELRVVTVVVLVPVQAVIVVQEVLVVKLVIVLPLKVTFELDTTSKQDGNVVDEQELDEREVSDELDILDVSKELDKLDVSKELEEVKVSEEPDDCAEVGVLDWPLPDAVAEASETPGVQMAVSVQWVVGSVNETCGGSGIGGMGGTGGGNGNPNLP
ncbi:hypothetical protein H2200_006472 [Cladophialophora chaetospira]|uniref:Uncharacterized protein n=1 Tax=Cladophialophora chaetospira TaxID=386627 RepID=A0AA38X897_9EURO|nr:hypothetical protein H2200_006472 [Cladophialophora chaetospira]